MRAYAPSGELHRVIVLDDDLGTAHVLLELILQGTTIQRVPLLLESMPGTSAYVRIRQHTSAYVSIRQNMSTYVRISQHTSAYVRIRQHTSAYVLLELILQGTPIQRVPLLLESMPDMLTYADVC
jgi:hypothetical protein